MKRKSHFILAYEVGKRTQQTCNQFMIKVMESIELPMPTYPMTFFSDGNRQFYESLKELYVPTCYRYGKLIKYKELGRLVKTEKEWIIGDGSFKEINTGYVSNRSRTSKDIILLSRCNPHMPLTLYHVPIFSKIKQLDIS